MKKRFLSMFALLLMAVTGAWAQTETLLTTITPTGKDTYSETTAGVVTVTPSNDMGWYDEEFGWCFTRSGSVTVEAKEGYTITRCVFKQNAKTPATITTSPFVITFAGGHCEQNYEMDGVTSIEVYGNAPAASTYSVTLAEGTEDDTKWTIEPNTGLKGGETVIASYSGDRKVKSVKAVKKGAAIIPVTSITLNKTETSIKVGSTETLSVTEVAPDNATDKTYTWKTSDASKATVDQDGKVTAVAVGTATIYAEANDGSGVKGNCTVTVTSAAPEYYNKLTKINDDYNEQKALLRQLYRGYPAYNSSLTAAQAYALATYQAAIDGKPVYVIMSVQGGGYEIHYALSTDAAATEHTTDFYAICDPSNPVRMYYVAQ